MSEDDRRQNRGWYTPSTQEELLGTIVARIDERTRNTETRVGEIAKDIGEMRSGFSKELSEVRTSLLSLYVSRTEFQNLAEKVNLHQKILFSVIGLVCLTVFGALLALVVQHGK